MLDILDKGWSCQEGGKGSWMQWMRGVVWRRRMLETGWDAGRWSLAILNWGAKKKTKKPKTGTLIICLLGYKASKYVAVWLTGGLMFRQDSLVVTARRHFFPQILSTWLTLHATVLLKLMLPFKEYHVARGNWAWYELATTQGEIAVVTNGW